MDTPDLLTENSQPGFLYNCMWYGGMLLSGVIGLIWYKQDSILYHPNSPSEKLRLPENMPPGLRNPRERGMDFENCEIFTRDKVKLHAWFVKANPNPRLCRTMIIFHGNAGNIGSRLPNIEVLVKQLKINVLILAYRGYGNSEGKPTEEGLYLDAQATLEFALSHEQIDHSRVFVFGRSLGGAVAANLAFHHQNRIRGLILENTFTSIPCMVDHIFPYVAYLKWIVLRLYYPTKDLIGKIETPILFMRGLEDEIVPCSHSATLYKLATSARFKVLYECESGDHNNLWNIEQDKYLKSLREFMEKCER